MLRLKRMYRKRWYVPASYFHAVHPRTLERWFGWFICKRMSPPALHARGWWHWFWPRRREDKLKTWAFILGVIYMLMDFTAKGLDKAFEIQRATAQFHDHKK